MLVYILGKVLLIEGVLMVLPILCGLIYGDSQVIYYALAALVYVGLGLLVSFFIEMKLRDKEAKSE